jgi:hypothetical protein
MKYLIIVLIVLAALVGAFYALNAYIYDEKQGGAVDPKNATYKMQDQVITLVNGRHEETSAPGEEVQWKTVTQYFGNDAKGDLNGDNVPDIAFILTQNGGGTGTFFYVVTAIQNPAGRFIGTNGVLIGDRIAPQTTEIRNGELIVNYADRRPDEPFSAQPTIGVSLRLKVDGQELAVIPTVD